MSLIYRTAGAWGAGKGSDLAPAEVDSNFYQLVQSVAAKAAQGVGIDHFIVSGNQLTVVLTDGTHVGPYTLPVASISFTGAWLPSHSYLVNQIFTEGGSTYIVTFNHTSASTFDPGANDGAGHSYYGLLLSNPSATLPTGGAVGSVLTKATTTDYSALWQLPTLAGLTDVLQSPGPTAGELVYWNGSKFSYLPQSSVAAAPQHLAGLADVLQSPSPATGDLVHWNGSKFSYLPAASLIPPTTNLDSLTDVNVSTGSAIDGDVLYWNNAAGFWEAKPVTAFFVNVNTQTSNYTLSLSDGFGVVRMTASGANTVTIPLSSSVNFAVGTEIEVGQTGAGPTTLVAASGVTVNAPDGLLFAKQHQYGRLRKTAVDTWNWVFWGLPPRADLLAQTVTQSGASLAIDRSLGEMCDLLVSANITSVAVTNWAPAGTLGKINLKISNGGAFAISGWPTGTIWPGGAAPTISSGAGRKDWIVLASDDGGTTIFGSVVGQNYG